MGVISVPDCSLEEGEEGGTVTGSAEHFPPPSSPEQRGEVTGGGPGLGAEGWSEGTTGSRQAGLGQKGPQRSRDLTRSFYRWEN